MNVSRYNMGVLTQDRRPKSFVIFDKNFLNFKKKSLKIISTKSIFKKKFFQKVLEKFSKNFLNFFFKNALFYIYNFFEIFFFKNFSKNFSKFLFPKFFPKHGVFGLDFKKWVSVVFLKKINLQYVPQIVYPKSKV